MITHPCTQRRRREIIDGLSAQLANMLGFIRRDGNKDEFIESIRSQIVSPAMSLYEGFLTSTNGFRLQIDPHLRAGKRFSGGLAELVALDCIDIAMNNRKLVVEKFKPPPSVEEIQKKLHIICTVYPSLIATRVGQGELPEDPYIACKERILVVWTEEENWKGLLSKKQPESSKWLYRIVSTVVILS